MIALEEAAAAIAEAAVGISSEVLSSEPEGVEALKGRAEALDYAALALSRLMYGPQGGKMDHDYARANGRGPAGFHRGD